MILWNGPLGAFEYRPFDKSSMQIANIISADMDKVAQSMPGTKINFKEVNLEEAENYFKAYINETNKYLNEHS